MLATDEDAVICDFAETYHVLDIGALDLRLAATLAAGLGPDSRIMRKLSGAPASVGTLLLARAVDHLAMLQWFGSEDGLQGVHRPESVLAALTGQQKAQPAVMSFRSGREFDAAWAQITRSNTDGN